MQTGTLLLLGLMPSVALGSSIATPHPHHLQPARFFFDPENRALLPAVREGMEKGISYNGHFSRSYVSCGLACGTFFFVDRWTGGVVVVPEGSPPREMTWDVEAKRNSDVTKVTFGPSDGMGPTCFDQHFELQGHKFAAIGAHQSTVPNSQEKVRASPKADAPRHTCKPVSSGLATVPGDPPWKM